MNDDDELKPEDVGLTQERVDNSARQMTYALIGGPEYWNMIPSTLIKPENLPAFRKMMDRVPEKLHYSFIEAMRRAAHAIIDDAARDISIWAMLNSRDDLLMSVGERMALAEEEEEAKGDGD